MKFGGSCALLGCLLAACASATEIGVLEPKPSAAPAGRIRAHLRLGPGVEDAYEPARRGKAPEVRLRGWRSTLARGFLNAGGRGGEQETNGPEPVVMIDRARLTLVTDKALDGDRERRMARLALAGDEAPPPVLLAHGGIHAPKTASPPGRKVYAVLSYSAALVDEQGRVVKRTAGTARSRAPASHSVSLADAVRSAVEVMYEDLIPELFPGTTERKREQT